MKKFKYTAYNLDHKKYTGFYFANDEQHLRTLLSAQQLFLISCKEVSDKGPNAFFSLSGKVKMKDSEVDLCNENVKSKFFPKQNKKENEKWIFR